MKLLLILTLVRGTPASVLRLARIFDFTAEQGPRRATVPGFLYLFLADTLASTGLCVACNGLLFPPMPSLVRILPIRRVLADARNGTAAVVKPFYACANSALARRRTGISAPDLSRIF